MAVARLEGKVAVITGGASGIGKACAIRFAEEGADIVISDLSAQRLADAAEEIRASTNGKVLPIEADVCYEEQLADLMQSTVDELGHIDCVVAAAGVSRATDRGGGGGGQGSPGSVSPVSFTSPETCRPSWPSSSASCPSSSTSSASGRISEGVS